MKKIIVKYLLFIPLSVLLFACKKDILNETVYSQLSAGNFLNTEEGINSVLNSAYDYTQQHGQLFEYRILIPALSSGITWGEGGSFEQNDAVPFTNFTWDINASRFQVYWTSNYKAIRNANIVLDNIDNEVFSQEFRAQKSAEAKALRGCAYAQLYSMFGGTPIFTTTKTESMQLPRGTDEEMRQRIQEDLTSAAEVLPVTQMQYGRVTKGAALALLCKHYLNTKQWQECANTAQQIIDLHTYELQQNYKSIFSINNERNKEIIWAQPSLATPASVAQNFIAITLPPDYPLLSNQANYAAHVYIFDSFLDSFDPSDVRKDLFIRQYTNISGNLVQGYGNNKSLIFKYEPDPNGVGYGSGLDLIEIRYADILLARAEALNELSGPTQEAIDLINSIRSRAHVDPLDLADFNKESLRDHILKERGWELYFEGKEREDLIRQGKYISNAVARGKHADEHHILYPIPGVEIDANPSIEQNPGYN